MDTYIADLCAVPPGVCGMCYEGGGEGKRRCMGER